VFATGKAEAVTREQIFHAADGACKESQEKGDGGDATPLPDPFLARPFPVAAPGERFFCRYSNGPFDISYSKCCSVSRA